jgi:hypothetical protein
LSDAYCELARERLEGAHAQLRLGTALPALPEPDQIDLFARMEGR